MSSDDRTTPKRVKAPHGATEMAITWADGHTSRLPHAILRGYCPCAECQGHSGTIRFQPGRNEELTGIEQVGNYALGLKWADGHSSGIYTHRYLRRLGDQVEEVGERKASEMPELPRG